MKPILQATLLICFLFAGSISIGSRHPISAAPAYGIPFIENDNQGKVADTSIKKTLKAPPDAGKGILKSIGNFFKFKANAQKQEKKRVGKIIDSLASDNRIAFTKKDIDSLSKVLAASRENKYDSLLFIINQMKTGGFSAIYSAAPSAKEAPESTFNGNAILDKDIDTQTKKEKNENEMQAAQDSKDSAKWVVLKTFADAKVKLNDTLTLNGPANQKYLLKLVHKAEIYGIYNYQHSPVPIDKDLSYISSLIYTGFFVNEKNGIYKPNNEWSANKTGTDIISIAQAKGCSVILSALLIDKQKIRNFLNNPTVWLNFIRSTKDSLVLRNANGINICFQKLSADDGEKFVGFIQMVSDSLRKINPLWKLYITVPFNNAEEAFIVSRLNKLVDHFVIDFNDEIPKNPGSFFKIRGKDKYSIDPVVNYFKGHNVEPNKLILTVPYSGIEWTFERPKTKSWINYDNIMKKQESWDFTQYNSDNTAFIDSLDKTGKVVKSIYYEDDESLSKIYDYVLVRGINGVALNALGFDSGYPELSDMLAYKFISIDTLKIIPPVITPRAELSWKEQWKRKWFIYKYILDNPCITCFNNAQDSSIRSTIHKYIYELKGDSLLKAFNDKITDPKDYYKKYISFFEYYVDEMTEIALWIALIVSILLAALSGFYFYMLITKDEGWKSKQRKWTEWTLILVSVIFISAWFTYIFIDQDIEFVGTGTSKSGIIKTSSLRASKKAAGFWTNFETPSIVREKNGTYRPSQSSKACTLDKDCFNTPLYNILLLIYIGGLLGGLLYRYVIASLTKPRDIP